MSCGCKGARYCAQCVNSERVRSLHVVANNVDVDTLERAKLDRFKRFYVYCNECARAFR